LRFFVFNWFNQENYIKTTLSKTSLNSQKYSLFILAILIAVMLLINPYYLVLNVQYIDTNRKFIMIDRKVWNRTIVSLNRVRKLDPCDIKRFKKEIYNMYITHMRKGKIDYEKFNKMCCDLLHVEWTSVNLEELGQEDEFQIVHNDGEPAQTPYYENSNTSVVDLISNGLLDKNFSNTVSIIRNINSLLTEDWNTLMLANKDCDDLLSYVGFSRTRSLISQIITSKEVKLYTKEEFVVLYMFRDFIINIIGDCNIHELMFFCQECLTVNCHKFRGFGRDKIEQQRCNLEQHTGKIKFFDYTQVYDEENEGYGLKQKLGFDIDGIFTDHKIYHSDTKINPGKFKKYHRIRNELVVKYNSLVQRDFFQTRIDSLVFKKFIEELPSCDSYYYDNTPVNWDLNSIFISEEYKLVDNLYHFEKSQNVITNTHESRPAFFGQRSAMSSFNQIDRNPFNLSFK
jgi:hypothetical protein